MSRNKFKLSAIYRVFALTRAMDYLKSWFNQIKISWLFVAEALKDKFQDKTKDKINFLREDHTKCSSRIASMSHILSIKKLARGGENEDEVDKMLRKFYQTQEPRQNKEKKKERV